MMEKKLGRIINLVGDSSRIGEANLAITAAARGGTIALGKSLAKELGRYNITVNTILSGGCLTDRVKDLIRQQYKTRNFKTILKKIEKGVPVQRIAGTEEFVQAIIFLCSDNASYINGVALPIDGGVSKSIF